MGKCFVCLFYETRVSWLALNYLAQDNPLSLLWSAKITEKYYHIWFMEYWDRM